MGLREQAVVGCFPEFAFQFSVVQVLVGLRKQFINNFVFPTYRRVLLVLTIIIIWDSAFASNSKLQLSND